MIEALRIQLILKGIISQSEWEEVAEDISINFLEDNYFAELKENEILKERIDMLDSLSDHIGKFYSTKWIRNNILRQTDEDIDRINKEISSEGDDVDDNEEDQDVESTKIPTQPDSIEEDNTVRKA